MKLLLLHSDFIEYEARSEAIKSAEKIKKQSDRIEECLAVFATAEKDDKEGEIKKAIADIKDIADQVKADKIVLYPWVHLSNKPASPDKALESLKKIESGLKGEYEVTRSPFGWYKSFTIKCKGHPLSELSREIRDVKDEPKKGKERKEGSEFHRYMIVDKEGKEYEVTPENWKDSEVWNKKEEAYKLLKIFVRNELDKNPKERDKPKHIEYMKKLELVDYCPESDVGHFKWFPKGLIIKDLILAFQENLARKYGAFKIQNPLVYRFSDKNISKLMGEFKEKDYRWQEGNEELVLRFASDPGAFPFMQKLKFSHKDMPIKEYEEAICFRKEQKGELSGLRRVRNFLMTDVHAFCKDEEQTKEEYLKLCFKCQDLMDNIIAKGRWVLGWEVVEAFYNEHKEWLLGIIKDMGVPSFIKMMPERSHYYSLKNEYQSIAADESNSQISTVQYDVVNGERFNITYTGEDNKDHPCIIIHCSTFGSIERTIEAILEKAAFDEKQGRHPMLPLWLSPTQIRIAPINDSFIAYAEELADRFDKEEIRVDVDDRAESISRKVRDAEKEWVPYTIVIGENEKKTEEYPLRSRIDGKINKSSFDEIVREIKNQTGGLPYKPLPLHRLVSKRPIFFG